VGICWGILYYIQLDIGISVAFFLIFQLACNYVETQWNPNPCADSGQHWCHHQPSILFKVVRPKHFDDSGSASYRKNTCTANKESEQRIIYEIQQNHAHFWNSSHMTIWPLNQSIIHYWMLLLITLLLLWVGTCPYLLFIRPLPFVVVSDRVAFNTLLVPHKRLSLSDLRIGPACRSTISQIRCQLNSS